MKTLTSISFNGLSGSAGMVTARDTRYGTILSGRCNQPGKITPQQKDQRALFARVGRSFRHLSPDQIDLWTAFAAQNSFGSRKQAHSPTANAYITLNSNRAFLGLDLLQVPPTQLPTIPTVQYHNIIVTPNLIQFSRLLNPGAGYRLSGRMSSAASKGRTYGGGLPVLVDAGFIPEQTFADVTRVYIDRLTVRPVTGRKYFVETAWMQVATGFAGPRTSDDRICQPNL